MEGEGGVGNSSKDDHTVFTPINPNLPFLAVTAKKKQKPLKYHAIFCNRKSKSLRGRTTKGST